VLVQPVQKHKFTTINAKNKRYNTNNQFFEKPILTYMQAMQFCNGRMGNILYIVLVSGSGYKKLEEFGWILGFTMLC
jgi:hypothetical protein